MTTPKRRSHLVLAPLALFLVAAPLAGQEGDSVTPPEAPSDWEAVPAAIDSPLLDEWRGPALTAESAMDRVEAAMSRRQTRSGPGPVLEGTALAVGAALLAGSLVDYADGGARPGMTAAQAGAFAGGAVLVGLGVLGLASGGENVVAGR